MFLMVISVTVEREGGGAPEAGTGLLLLLFQERR